METPSAGKFDVVLERDAEGFFVANVPALHGCHTQARSLDELMNRIKEAITLYLEVEGAPDDSACCWYPSPSEPAGYGSSAPASRQVMSAKTTKKEPGRKRRGRADLAKEYRFDYSKSKPNRFAKRAGRGVTMVILDSDVAAVFHDSKRVNAALRATIRANRKRISRKAS